MGNGIVAKFGGSSVKDALAMRRCAEVVKSYSDTRIVIISATYNTTNMLERLAQTAKTEGEQVSLNVLVEIETRHRTIAQDLNVSSETLKDLEQVFHEARDLILGVAKLRECSPRIMDQIYSLGERMSSRLFADALGQALKGQKKVVFFDVRKVLKTSSDWSRAQPLMDLTKAQAEEHLFPVLADEQTVVVTQGFIGSTVKGDTTTLGREGSDFSGALMAEVIKADVLQIWTDVPGVATTDPRLVPEAKIISELTYDEASAMAHLGAKVLFSKTLLPVMRENIPVFVGSSIEPQKGGSWIRPSVDHLPFLRALAVMKKQTLVTVESNEVLPQALFSKNIFDIIDRYKIPTDFFSFRASHVNFLVPEQKFLNDDVVKELSEFARVKIEEDLALISLIGNDMDQASSQVFDVFFALAQGKPAIRMMQFGVSASSMSFLVPATSTELISRELHNALLLRR